MKKELIPGYSYFLGAMTVLVIFAFIEGIASMIGGDYGSAFISHMIVIFFGRVTFRGLKELNFFQERSGRI